MDFNTILEAIASVGFPIVCVAVMFYENHMERTVHKEETEQFTNALNKNTLVIQQLVDKLEGKV